MVEEEYDFFSIESLNVYEFLDVRVKSPDSSVKLVDTKLLVFAK